MTDLPHSRGKDRINPVVFYASAGLILLFSPTTILFRNFSALWIGRTLDRVSKTFSWYHLLAATLYVVFVVCIACSCLGSVKLGSEQSKPEFSLLSQAVMLFAAGIDIDLMFFSVAGPVTQYMQSPESTGQAIEAARQAMVWTLFHHGLAGWSMYALMGMTLGYFSYRYNLPLTIRSALYPIFGKRINGPISHSMDTIVVIGTIFGIVATLGIGVVQLNYGLGVLFDIPDSTTAKAALVALSMIIATISVTFGVDRGIRMLSEFNVALALGLILFALFMGDTSFLLNALMLNVGDYVNRSMGMTLNSFASDRLIEWMNDWMLFLWVWRVAWPPFVGLFLARISRGCTIRQLVLGTLIIPFTFTLLWLPVLGNSALYGIVHGGTAFTEEVMVHSERGFYSLLVQYPASTFSASAVTTIGLLFYVISADSGTSVLGNFTLQLKDINSDAPGWLRVFWSVVIGLLTLGMPMTNGISALQNTMVIMGLSLGFVISSVMAGLYKSLGVKDYHRESANRDTAPRPLGLQDRLSWEKRLSCLTNYPGMCYTKQMMETVCYPVTEEVAQELRLRGAYAELRNLPPEEGQQLGHLDLLVHMDEEQNFVYQVWPQQHSVPGFTYRVCNGKSTYHRLETLLLEDSQGNDLIDYSKEQVITDTFDQYEWHPNFIHLHREAPGYSMMSPDS